MPETGSSPSSGGSPGALDRAMALAVVCQALAGGLTRPARPDRGSLRGLRSALGRHALEQAAAVLDQGEPGALRQAVARLTARRPPSLARLQSSFDRLFGHALRGQVCAYGSEHGAGAPHQQAHELADLSGFYLAFGLRPAAGRGERLDHVALELEFLRFLALKEAYAREVGDVEMLEVTHQAQRDFLRRHLGCFGCAFAVSLQKADPEGFYGWLGSALEALLRLEAAHLNVPVGPDRLERFLLRYGKWLRLTPEDIAKAERWFDLKLFPW